MPVIDTPLRYPGGKSKLSNYIKSIFRLNKLCDGDYVEPFAGGAGVAITLLLHEYVMNIHINDIDRAIYAFWNSALFSTDSFCQRIERTPINMDVWHQQKEVFENQNDHDLMDLGFATFFLNRTNRSGILSAGVVGGKNQMGQWKLDARFNKTTSIQKIKKLGRYRNRINLYNTSTEDLITGLLPEISQKSLVYLDPPYYEKGQSLYTNFYTHRDHVNLSNLIQQNITQPWLISYDNVEPIRQMYTKRRQSNYGINYMASDRYQGSELMIFCDSLKCPDVIDPLAIKPDEVQSLMAMA